jgi:hypothetical protein
MRRRRLTGEFGEEKKISDSTESLGKSTVTSRTGRLSSFNRAISF